MKRIINCVNRPDSNLYAYKPLFDLGFTLDFHNLNHTQDEHTVIRVVKGYDYVIAGSELWSRKVFETVKDSLKMLVRHGIGMDSVDLQAAADNNIAVSNTPGANAFAVAEHALGMLLCLLRNIHNYDTEMKKNIWNILISPSLSGTIGLLGFGAIGQEFAKILKPFPVEIIAFDVKRDNAAAERIGVEFVSFDELLTRSDFLSIHAAVTPETVGIINNDTIMKMKNGAFIINTSRGSLIDEEALCAAIREKRVAGAALDVFAAEPLQKESPLFKLDNVVLTPHAASSSEGGIKSMVEMCVSNIHDFYLQRPFKGLIIPKIKDKEVENERNH